MDHEPTARSRSGPGLGRHVALVGIALPWVAWAVVRVFGLDRGQMLELLMPFTPIVVALAPLAIAVALLVRVRLAAALVLAAALAMAVAIAPRALDDGGAPDPSAGARLTVMSLNMDDGRADPATLVRLVRRLDVDVLALVETRESLPRLDDAGLKAALPYRLSAPYSRGGGASLLSRSPLNRIDLPQLTGYPEPPAALMAVPGARTLRVSVHHPPHATTRQFAAEWRRRLRALPAASAGGHPSVALGDFNATLDQHALRAALATTGLRDAADVVGAGLRMTWPAESGVPALLAIDHVFVGRGIGVRAFRTVAVPHTDHHAIVATLAVPQ